MLKSCPFCGKQPNLEQNNSTKKYWIHCDNPKCRIQPFGDMHTSKSVVVREWNRRCGQMITAQEISEATGFPTYEQLKEWCEANTEGRLLILPCKVGTRVYIKYCQFIPVCCDGCISGHGFDSDCDYFERSQEYCGMELQHDKFGRTMGIASKRFTYDMIPQFGRTVFLTREEAEAALNGGNDG